MRFGVSARLLYSDGGHVDAIPMIAISFYNLLTIDNVRTLGVNIQTVATSADNSSLNVL